MLLLLLLLLFLAEHAAVIFGVDTAIAIAGPEAIHHVEAQSACQAWRLSHPPAVKGSHLAGHLDSVAKLIGCLF